MSTTVIHGFGMDGICTGDITEASNAWRGAIAVWKLLEKKYLPPYRPMFVPDYVKDDEIEEYLGHESSRLYAFSDSGAMKDIWDLIENGKVSLTDKIVLGTTLDYVLVRRENIPNVIEAFEAFDKEHEGMTNLKEQADGLRAFYEDEEVSAVGWNQTSVNGDDWSNAGEMTYDGNGGMDRKPYNFNTGNKHWWLFDELNKSAEAQHEK